MRRDEVTARLSNARRAVDLAGLADAFSAVEAMALCDAAAWVGPTLPSLIRNAVGRELAAVASDAAMQGRPCDWSPCCAFSIFYQDVHPVAGAAAIPLVEPQADGALLVAMRLIGWADLWAESVADALVRGLRGGVGARSREATPTQLLPRERRIAVAPPPDVIDGPLMVTMITPARPRDDRPFPVDGAPSPVFGPADWAALGRALADRFTAVAPWCDVRFDPDEALALRADWEGLSARGEVLWTPAVVGARGRKPTDLSGWTGVIYLEDPPPRVRAALCLAQATHFGRHIGKGGLGRLLVTPAT